ncbi:hypothetical protein LTR50_005054 [Elasticomyces elasticus]|nr:hypothetical protein LTR50_005054 [Elasticomyces elasticus]
MENTSTKEPEDPNAQQLLSLTREELELTGQLLTDWYSDDLDGLFSRYQARFHDSGGGLLDLTSQSLEYPGASLVDHLNDVLSDKSRLIQIHKEIQRLTEDADIIDKAHQILHKRFVAIAQTARSETWMEGPRTLATLKQNTRRLHHLENVSQIKARARDEYTIKVFTEVDDVPRMTGIRTLYMHRNESFQDLLNALRSISATPQVVAAGYSFGYGPHDGVWFYKLTQKLVPEHAGTELRSERDFQKMRRGMEGPDMGVMMYHEITQTAYLNAAAEAMRKQLASEQSTDKEEEDIMSEPLDDDGVPLFEPGFDWKYLLDHSQPVVHIRSLQEIADEKAAREREEVREQEECGKPTAEA